MEKIYNKLAESGVEIAEGEVEMLEEKKAKGKNFLFNLTRYLLLHKSGQYLQTCF